MTTEKTLSANHRKPDRNLEKTNPRLTREKPKSYLNVNDLEVPEEIKAMFDKGGYILRFVRFIKPGTTNEIDYQNLGKRVQQGYTFVSTIEAPEMALTSFKRDIDIVGFEGGDFKDVIVKGDLALMKVSKINSQERQREVSQITRDQMRSVDLQAQRGALINDSSSKTQTVQRQRRESRDVGFAEDL